MSFSLTDIRGNLFLGETPLLSSRGVDLFWSVDHSILKQILSRMLTDQKFPHSLHCDSIKENNYILLFMTCIAKENIFEVLTDMFCSWYLFLLPQCILAWRVPRTEEPGGLQSSGSQRVAHN